MADRVLVVEDEYRMRELIVAYFKKEGYEVLEAGNGNDAIDIFEREKVDLVILDVMIPGMYGWEVCKYIRNISSVPIIMLTAKSEEEDKLLGFELGADEYVTKPFSPKVLVARSRNLLKRVKGDLETGEGVIHIDGIKINTLSYEVKVNDKVIATSPKEYELLYYLVENKNRVCTREKILDRVWGYDYMGDYRVVDTHIKKLRSKLGEHANLIKTIIRVGYMFEVKK
ncbi:response regulator transcription factor [Acidaminobacter sp. JC074]|uniref:response regulator transcription factor n=1 Tax=Acidaminobacter sp. JC074 TaxID=2530199 RepID=UPI001F0F5B5E|nr:response regulator transcription factor [Acidaminobacter sp. JC074]MCH4887196.1 response regulator transcription factor [Acidaminobacter sp. JC074]